MEKNFGKLTTPIYTTGKTSTKVRKLNGFAMFTILFSLFMLIIGVTAGLTYAGFQSTASSNGTLTFAVNGHQGTMNLTHTNITNYTSTDLLLTFTLASETNYTTPSISGITVGGVALTESSGDFKTSTNVIVATYSAPTLTINRANVSGDLVITGSSTASTYTITYNANGGTGTMTASTPSYGSDFTLSTNTFTRTGYAFAGWSRTSGGDVAYGNSTIVKDLANITLYAVWVANELTFDNQNQSKTFSTASQNITFTGASSGTGTYTYDITAGNDDSYFSISGTTVTVGANTPVGVYNLAITATDSGSSKTRTSIISITINYITLGTPVVSISTTGMVTWGAITGASSYDISIDGTTWTSGVSSAYDYFSAIVASTGSRTVRVRANPSASYDASKIGTASVNVYAITVAGTNGTVRVSRTSTAGNDTTLNFISGATAYIFATASTGYHFVNWTKNTGNAPASTTTANTSLTVNATATHTANFAINTYTVSIVSNNTGYGTVSHTSVESVPYGTVITQSGNTVTINGTTVTATAAATTAQYTYSFSSWTNGTATVQGAITVTANFSRTTRSYTITVSAGSYISSVYGTTTQGAGSGSTSVTANYGTAVYLYSTLGSESGYNYSFSSWSRTSGTGTITNPTTQNGAYITITGNATVTATGNRVQIIYTFYINLTGNMASYHDVWYSNRSDLAVSGSYSPSGATLIETNTNSYTISNYTSSKIYFYILCEEIDFTGNPEDNDGYEYYWDEGYVVGGTTHYGPSWTRWGTDTFSWRIYEIDSATYNGQTIEIRLYEER